MHTVSPEKLATFFKLFPDLLPLITQLNHHEIKWLIGGSGCLFLYGNERTPGDVDILLPNHQHDTVDTLFGIQSFTYSSVTESVRNSNPNNDHELQFTSDLTITIDAHKYTFDYGAQEIQQKAAEAIYNGQSVRIAPPEEALLVKGILQRGDAEGKHDIEDVKNFLSIYTHIDTPYLEQRISSLNAEARVGGIFKKQHA